MQHTRIVQMGTLVLLILASAYFSAIETALMSLGRLRVRHLVDEGVSGAKRVERLLKKPGRLLGTILIGNNLVNIAATSLATLLTISYYGEGTGVGVATVGMTLIILVFGEITPKTYALHHSQKLSLKLSSSLSVLYAIFCPLSSLLEKVSRSLLWVVGVH
ncbi:MAG: CNNM domain-containing protein, partial [Bacillota bacterium]|nr:CNNM domain-containing protein [Bacillota bacterium]